MHTPKLIVVVGSPGSGKDILVRAVNDLGSQHAHVIPKHTSRERRDDDGQEMICSDDVGHALDGCDIIYRNYDDIYGIESKRIWKGLEQGVFQVIVVSNIEAINRLREIFGNLMILVYVHSQMEPKAYKKLEGRRGGNKSYIEKRLNKYRMAFDIYVTNFLAFDHVLLYTDVDEDLYDQIFRLFRAYETGLLK